MWVFISVGVYFLSKMKWGFFSLGISFRNRVKVNSFGFLLVLTTKILK